MYFYKKGMLLKVSESIKKSESIILIGMPGCGKSTIGIRLAKVLHRKFLDSDLLIQRREKIRLQQIINIHGNEYFAEAEERALLSIQPRGQVIATGGSAVFYPKAMEYLKTVGKIIYIEIPFSSLKKRLWNIKTRGIVFKPGQDLEGLFREREPLYRKYADISIRNERQSADEMVERIVHTLSETK